MSTVAAVVTPGLRVAEGDVVIDRGAYGTVALVSAAMPGYLAVDFDGVLAIKHLDELLVRDVRTVEEFTARLAHENAWSVGRAGCVVRQILATAGFPPAVLLTEAHWEWLARQHFDAAVHRATFRSLVGA